MESASFIQLPSLNFPEKYHFRLKNNEQNQQIFCPIRKKWYVLTPEEWVRQHTFQLLHQTLNYPLGSIAAEYKVDVYGLNQRADILVFKKEKPFILVECKKPSVAVNQTVFDQIARYNQQLKADYLMLTNGLQHIFCQMDFTEKKFDFLEQLPSYNHLK